MESLEFGGLIWILWVTLTPRNIKLNELKKQNPKTPKNYILMNDNENWPSDSACCANKQNDSTIYDTLCISGFSFYF